MSSKCQCMGEMFVLYAQFNCRFQVPDQKCLGNQSFITSTCLLHIKLHLGGLSLHLWFYFLRHKIKPSYLQVMRKTMNSNTLTILIINGSSNIYKILFYYIFSKINILYIHRHPLNDLSYLKFWSLVEGLS